MDNIKSIISNNKGQKDYNFLPPSVLPATYIKGKKGDTPITMEGIQYPMIALDKYGVTFQQPDQRQPGEQQPGQEQALTYNYKSKGVLEIPFMPGSIKKDEEMPTAQRGGSQGDQMQQLIIAYAQIKSQQEGREVSPEEIMRQLQQLSPKEQNDALSAIAEQVQQVMAQQQQQEQQMAMQQQGAGPGQQQAMMGQEGEEEMMEEEQGMMGQGMMNYGGEPCIDCFDNYNPSPQAQNLNWFYKKEGGPFSAANTYPLDWATYSGNQYVMGGNTVLQSDPNAQTYLPYMREGETRPNFMFQKGGSLYDYAKSLGIDPSYASRKKMFSKYFNEEYTGTAEQNTYLLNALKSGKIRAEGVHPKAERPKLGQPSVPYSISTPSAGSPKQTKVQPKKTETPKKTATPVQTVQQPLQYQWSAGYTNAPKDNLMVQSPSIDKVVSTPSKKTTTAPKKTETKKVNTSADQRQIPQTGVIVDKRTGEAIVLGNTNTMKFPVLTGAAGADANFRGQYMDPFAIPSNEAVTPRGYYMMLNSTHPDNAKHYENNVKVLRAIPAFGMDDNLWLNQANNVVPAVHQTYDPAYRNQFYNMPAEQRYISKGCVNCEKPNYLGMMQTLNNQNDTVLVVDSKLPQDQMLWNQAQQQFETRPKNPVNQYTAIATERELGGQSDIDRAYQMMKEGGFDMNPKKKKGGKFNHLDEFRKYLEKGGGLPMAQTGKTTIGDYADPNGNPDWTYTKGPNGWIAYNKGKAINMFGNPKWTTDPKLMGSVKALDDTWNAMKSSNLSGASGWQQTIQNKSNTANTSNKTSTDPFDAGNITSPQPDTTWNMNDQGVNALKTLDGYNIAPNVKKGVATNSNPSQQYTGNVNADNYTITKWNNGNIKKIKGTPNRSAGSTTWNSPSAAYLQASMNSKLFGTSALGMGLSAITGALNPSAAPTGSTFKAKYRPDGSLRKVKGSAADVYNFFNPKTETTDNTASTTSSTTGTTTGTSGATTPSTTTASTTSAPVGFGSNLFNSSTNINDYRRDMMGNYRQQDYLNRRKQTMGFALGGAYDYLPMAQLGPEINLSQSNNLSQPQSNPYNLYNTQTPAAVQNSSAFQAIQNANQNATKIADTTGGNPGNDVKVKTTDDKGGFGVNKTNTEIIGAAVGATNAVLQARTANREQNAATARMESQSAMNNPAYNTGNATQTQFGSNARAINSGDIMGGAGNPSNIGTNLNYNQQLFNNAMPPIQQGKLGGSLYDRYEDGGEYDLTDEEIEEILAAGGSVEYI